MKNKTPALTLFPIYCIMRIVHGYGVNYLVLNTTIAHMEACLRDSMNVGIQVYQEGTAIVSGGVFNGLFLGSVQCDNELQKVARFVSRTPLPDTKVAVFGAIEAYLENGYLWVDGCEGTCYFQSLIATNVQSHGLRFTGFDYVNKEAVNLINTVLQEMDRISDTCYPDIISGVWRPHIYEEELTRWRG